MGYDLQGDGGCFRWQQCDWGRVLHLACHYGWRPSGTVLLAEDGKHIEPWWCRAYDPNDGQMVLKTDARRIAIALRKALIDHAKTPRKKKLAKAIHSLGGVEYLTEFIKFCRAGPFCIF